MRVRAPVDGAGPMSLPPELTYRTYVVPSVRPGPSTLLDARVQFGHHARLGLSVRPSGDRWWPTEHDSGDYEGRHRRCQCGAR